MKKTMLKGLAAAVFATIAVPALALQAEVTTDLNVRAGPGTKYPRVTTVPGGRDVTVYGCLRSYNWCDISWRGTRGWVSGKYLHYFNDNRTRPLSAWGPRVGVPAVSFSFGTYVDRHYRGRDYYDDLYDWRRGGRRAYRRDDRDGRRYERRGDRVEFRHCDSTVLGGVYNDGCIRGTGNLPALSKPWDGGQ